MLNIIAEWIYTSRLRIYTIILKINTTVCEKSYGQEDLYYKIEDEYNFLSIGFVLLYKSWILLSGRKILGLEGKSFV